MTSRARLRHMTNTIALLAFCVVAGVAQAADSAYPTRPIRLVVGFAPGGAVDATARIIAPKLSDAMGQNWVVDSRTGAGGNLATEIVARANPDGYTALMAIDAQLTANPTLFKLTFSVEKDLQPITMLASTNSVVAVHPNVQANTFKEFVALAKQKPGTLHFGTSVGGSNHLIVELLKKFTGIDLVHVPYKGSGPAALAVLAGEIEVLISSPASMIGFIKAGRLRALALTGAKRSKLLPELPTVAESGYPGFEAIQWYGLVVPGATPKRIVERIHSEALKALQSADVQASMERLGLDPVSTTPAELAARIKKETATWAGIIKDAGIRVR